MNGLTTRRPVCSAGARSGSPNTVRLAPRAPPARRRRSAHPPASRAGSGTRPDLPIPAFNVRYIRADERRLVRIGRSRRSGVLPPLYPGGRTPVAAERPEVPCRCASTGAEVLATASAIRAWKPAKERHFERCSGSGGYTSDDETDPNDSESERERGPERGVLLGRPRLVSFPDCGAQGPALGRPGADGPDAVLRCPVVGGVERDDARQTSGLDR